MDKIIDEYIDGMNPANLGNKYGCDSTTIRRRLMKAGIVLRSMAEAQMIELPIDKIIDEYNNGMDTVILAEKYGCHSNTIRNRLKKAGVVLRHISEIKTIVLPMDDIITEYNSGASTTIIGEKYGCNRVTIRNKLIERGITIRSGLEAKNELHMCTCSECGSKFMGKSTASYCEKCNSKPYCHKFDKDCKIRNRDKYNNACFFCGKTGKENEQALGCHHADYNKNQGCDDTSNWKLVPLCKTCHGITGGGKKNRDMWEARIVYLHKEYWKKEV